MERALLADRSSVGRGRSVINTVHAIECWEALRTEARGTVFQIRSVITPGFCPPPGL
jgi:hypothetical protein